MIEYVHAKEIWNKKKRKESIVTKHNDKRRILFIFHSLIFNKTKYFILTDPLLLMNHLHINHKQKKKRTNIYM